MQLLLIRHGESLKNLQFRHGGGGARLTEHGRRQMVEVPGRALSLTARSPVAIYYSDRVHARESGLILATAWNVRAFPDPKLDPLYLGALDGLSDEEALAQEAAAAAALEAWRRGRRPISGVHLRNAEPLERFVARGSGFLEERYHVHRGELIAVVGTRSVLIMLMNLLLGDRSRFPEGYRVYDILYGLAGLYGYGPETGDEARS